MIILGDRRGGRRLGKMLSVVGLNSLQAHRKWDISGISTDGTAMENRRPRRRPTKGARGKPRKQPEKGFRIKPIAYVLLGLITFALGVLVAFRVADRETAVQVDKVLAAYREDMPYGELTISYPLDGTLFPPEIAAPTVRWEDSRDGSDAWVVTIEFERGQGCVSSPCLDTEWVPSDEQWETIKQQSLERKAKVTVLGLNRAAPRKIISAGSISISTSKDEVGAPLFYREVNLPFEEAVKDPAAHIRWRFGTVASREPPAVVLDKLPVCGNCHSFSADGTVMGMDVDYANDKGSYVIDAVAEEMTLQESNIITWSEYKKEDKEKTFGLLSQVSPDGRFVVSTVKDRSVFVARDNLAFSQLFFPIKGILAIYDRRTGSFRALPGADDERFVQSNPTWSPDGKHIVFARSEAYRLEHLKSETSVLLTPAECREFLEEGRTFQFDLYRVPFNEGGGGRAEALAGASNNGMSNYFPKYSPDGRWIVFCRAKSFMLLQPDSGLYIVPAAGGAARRMRCNTPRMNSWHSWSPNGKWLVFSSKANSVYTQLFLTHIDRLGRSSPPVVLSRFTAPDRAANIPEFVNTGPGAIRRIRAEFLDDFSYLRAGNEFFRHGDFERAAELYRKALELKPDSLVAHRELGLLLLAQKRFEEAKAHFLKVLDSQADSELTKNAHCNLGIIFREQLGYQKAVMHCRKALEIDAEYATAHGVLGNLLLNLGRPEEAKEHLAEAVRLDRADAIASSMLADVLLEEGKHQQAAELYGRSLKEQPNVCETLLGLATIRAASSDPTLRDGDQAVELAVRACELTGYLEPWPLDVLGMAYAETGRFRDAVSSAQRAVRIARAAGNNDLADAIEQRIRLYEWQKAFRRQDLP